MRRTLEEWQQFGCGKLEEFLQEGDTVPLAFVQRLYGFADRADEETLYIQDKHPTDVLGSEGLYHTFYRDNKLLPFTYCGECPPEALENRGAEVAERIFICSPFHAENAEDSAFYELLAIYAARQAWNNGHFPVVPHLYFPRFLKDTGMEREYGIEAGHLLMRGCTGMRVYLIDGYISSGMRSDIEYAVNQLGITPVCINLTRRIAEQLIERAGI